MTREEAIEMLVNATYSDEWQGNEKLTTAHLMAIEALQTPPISQRSMYQAGYRQAQEDRPKGEWINTAPSYRSDNIVCDQCGYDSIARYNFCPNCGADMRGGEDE